MNINQWFAYLHGQPLSIEKIKWARGECRMYSQINFFFKTECHKPLRKIIWKYCSGSLHSYYCNLLSAIVFFSWLILACIYQQQRETCSHLHKKILKTTCTYEKNQVRKKHKIDEKESSDVNKVAYLRLPFLLCSLHNFWSVCR